MRPIPASLVAVVLVGCFIAAIAVAGGQESSVSLCEGLYKDRRLTPDDLETVLSNHRAWLHSKREPNDTRKANLCQARLSGANLRGADLSQATLQGANLSGANLQGAHLVRANLQETFLVETMLQQANLREAHLAGALFEPHPEALPLLWTLASPHSDLKKVVFYNSPVALFTLREAFKKAAMYTQERQLTYAIERTGRLLAWDPSWVNPKAQDRRPWLERLAGKSESLLTYMVFELPSGYGTDPLRALENLIVLIGLFSLLYILALRASGRAGIWVVWLPDRVYQEEGSKDPARVTSTFMLPTLQARAAGRWWASLLRGLSVWLIGLHVSLLSAFYFGWREFNVGAWIARLPPREYTLRTTGWVRTVSGIQSLLSMYLLALWVLNYLSRQ